MPRLFGSPAPPALAYSWADLNALAERVVRRHVAVPGVQPKLSLHLERGAGARGRLTLVGMEGGFILKPPVDAFPEMPELEHVTLRMAEAMGMETAEGGLIALTDGRWAFLSRRMDRDGERKRHMEDLCQLTDRLTERKYSGSVEQIGRVLWRVCENPGFDAVSRIASRLGIARKVLDRGFCGDRFKQQYAGLIEERAGRLGMG